MNQLSGSLHLQPYSVQTLRSALSLLLQKGPCALCHLKGIPPPQSLHATPYTSASVQDRRDSCTQASSSSYPGYTTYTNQSTPADRTSVGLHRCLNGGRAALQATWSRPSPAHQHSSSSLLTQSASDSRADHLGARRWSPWNGLQPGLAGYSSAARPEAAVTSPSPLSSPAHQPAQPAANGTTTPLSPGPELQQGSSGDAVAAAAAAEPAPAPAAAAAAPIKLLQVVATPNGPSHDRLLMRDFIQNSLYHPLKGYFNSPVPPVGSLHNPINYWKIYCRDEFNIVVSNKYRELQTSFLTPAELFSPHYGACIARHMVEHRKHHLAMEGQPFHIYEIGGGNGTLARDILDWLRANRPAEYALTTYHCVEISDVLAGRQYARVVGEGRHANFRLLRGSGVDRATWGARQWQHCFVLMMEVLDNLPHDRVYRARPSDPWQQTAVRPAGPAATMEEGPWQEVLEPISDPLLTRALAATYRAPSREEAADARLNRVLDFILARDVQATATGEVVFVPSAACALLELLHDLRPNHSIIAADFDRLPDVVVAGRNAPLIAQKVEGRNIDHGTLFVPWGSADIFFPTDFDALCDMYCAAAQHMWGPGAAGNDTAAAAATPLPSTPSSAPPDSVMGDVNAEHFRQGAVIKRYREMFNTATICAFNPMVDDFVNARFFLADAKGRYPPGRRPPPGVVAATSAATARQKQKAGRGLGLGIKQHIPAAPASKTNKPKPAAPEPVLGGRRLPRGGGGGGLGGAGGGKTDGSDGGGNGKP